jgi:serine palmitoyltransferase
MLFSPPSPEQARKIAREHAQFAPISHPSHRYVSVHPKGKPVRDPVEDEPPYYYLLTTYISYLVLIIFGHVRDFFGKIFREKNYKHLKTQNVIWTLAGYCDEIGVLIVGYRDMRR